MLIRWLQETTLRIFAVLAYNSCQLVKNEINWTTVTRASMRSDHVLSWKKLDIFKSKSFNNKVAQVKLQANKIS